MGWVHVLHKGVYTRANSLKQQLHSGYSFILRGEEKIPVPSKLSTRSLSIETGDILQIHNQYYKLVMENETPVEQPQPIEDMPTHPSTISRIVFLFLIAYVASVGAHG